ncbi:Insect cuticle protein [Trinorchestia longiramus]|nr:Insect cuticle protein [Trinorchestia longiramus]
MLWLAVVSSQGASLGGRNQPKFEYDSGENGHKYISFNYGSNGVYQFAYQLRDQSRFEERDEDGEVRGAFSFVDPEEDVKEAREAFKTFYEDTVKYLAALSSSEAETGRREYERKFGRIEEDTDEEEDDSSSEEDEEEEEEDDDEISSEENDDEESDEDEDDDDDDDEDSSEEDKNEDGENEGDENEEGLDKKGDNEEDKNGKKEEGEEKDEESENIEKKDETESERKLSDSRGKNENKLKNSSKSDKRNRGSGKYKNRAANSCRSEVAQTVGWPSADAGRQPHCKAKVRNLPEKRTQL